MVKVSKEEAIARRRARAYLGIKPKGNVPLFQREPLDNLTRQLLYNQVPEIEKAILARERGIIPAADYGLEEDEEPPPPPPPPRSASQSTVVPSMTSDLLQPRDENSSQGPIYLADESESDNINQGIINWMDEAENERTEVAENLLSNPALRIGFMEPQEQRRILKRLEIEVTKQFVKGEISDDDYKDLIQKIKTRLSGNPVEVSGFNITPKRLEPTVRVNRVMLNPSRNRK